MKRIVPPPSESDAPRPEISKAERILNLVSFLLKCRAPVTWPEIREKVIGYGDKADDKTLERRFERDKKELRQIGIPVLYLADDGFGNAGYTIPKDQYFLPTVRLAPEEVLLLQYLSRTALSDERGPIAEHLASALMKFSYDSLDQEGVADHRRIFGGEGPRRRRRARTSRQEANLRLLSEAVLSNRVVRFSYYTFSRDSVGSRRVDPYGLALYMGSWYLVGYSHERSEIRSFKVDRIQGEVKVSRKSHTFTPPEDFRIEGFVGKQPWEMAQRKPLKAEVRFHPDIAWMIPAVLRSPDPLKTDSRGWGKLKMDVHAPERLISWVLKFGDQAEIVAPASLRKALVRSLRAARARYRRRGRRK